ncbi:MAG: hypothetical protein QM764_01730 [Chitinophagaceae bacterium]
MTNTLSMTDPFEARKNRQATLITAGFAAGMVLLMFLLKWQPPTIPIPEKDEGILVELNLPDDPPAKVLGGGGGGGNPVQATGEKGTAHTPPSPGVKEDIKDVDEDETEKESPPIKKPDIPKPEAKKIDENHSVVKTPPKVVIETPAPQKAKALLGKTTGGSSTGGGAADNYDRSGGSGKGNGVGTGNGSGGGTGNGTGGGNGTGSGTGTGPRRVSGSRYVKNPKPMNAGENISGMIKAEISVTADGIGTYIGARGGSLMNDQQAIRIVQDWLRKNRFEPGEASNVVYEFNIKLGG